MTLTTNPRILTVNAFSQALIDAGVISADDRVRKLVIVADANEDAVVMYLERWGDERLLQVATTLDGIEIRGVPAADA